MAAFSLSFIFFALAILIGTSIWFWVLKRELNIFSLVCGFVIGTVVSAWSIFLLSWILKEFSLMTIFAPILILTILSFKLLQGASFQLPKLSKKTLLVVLLYLPPLIFICWVYSHLLYFENGNIMTGWATVWADWAAHLTYTTSFVYGNNFPPQLPIFPPQVFSYPFLVDFLSAILMKLGVDLVLAQVIPSLLTMLAGFILFTWLIYKVSAKIRITLITTLLFFCNGGLGIFYKLQNPQIFELTKIPIANIQWMSFLTSQFVPQRGLTMAFPFALTIFYLFYEIWKGNLTKRIYFTAGLLTSLLPLVHMHSFLICLGLAFFLFLKSLRNPKLWLYFFLPLLLISVPTIFIFFARATGDHFIRLQIGWLAKENWWVFWFKNAGLMSLLPVIGFIKAPRQFKLISLPFWTIFIVANLVVFQPWDWDNTKLFLYWYIGAAFLSGWLIDWLLQKNLIIKLGAVILIGLSIASGLYDNLLLTRTEQNKLVFFTAEQIDMAKIIRTITPPNSLFLTAENHDNPIAALGGRKILMGYPGWLWSYGIDYSKRAEDIVKIKTGTSEANQLLQKYQVDYVVIGPHELSQGFNQDYFAKNFPAIYKTNDYAIYKIK